MPSDKFEHKLSQKLQQARMVPPPGLFEAIEANLPDAPPAKRRPLFWWWAGGAGMLALAAAIALLLMMRSGNEERISPATTIDKPALSSTAEPTQAVSPTAPAPSHLPAEDENKPLSSTTETPNPLQETEQNTSGAAGGAERMLAHASHSKTDIELSEGKLEAHIGADPSVAVQTPLVVDPVPLTPGSDSLMENQDLLESVAQQESLHVAGVEINDALFEQLARAPQALPGVAYEWTPWMDLSPKEVRGNWYSRLAFQPEYAGRGNPLQVFSTPNVDHSLLESDQRFISQQAAPVHVVNYPRQRFTSRIFIGKSLGPKLSVEVGLALSLSEQGRYRQGLSSPELLVNGPITADMAVREFSVQHLWQQNYLELPVRLNYQIWRRGANGLNIQAGLAVNRTLQNLQQSRNSLAATSELGEDFSNNGLSLAFSQEGGLVTSEEVELLRIRPWHSHFAGGIQYERQMGKAYRFYLGPSVKYLLTGAYGGQAATGQMRYYLGVEMGLRLGQ